MKNFYIAATHAENVSLKARGKGGVEMYNIYAAYINSEGTIVVDGENGFNTYPDCKTIEEAKQLYMIGE